MNNIHTDVEDWRHAGAIAATALRYGRDQIKVGASMLAILDSVEEKITELGGDVAWAQMSFGSTAAHDCAEPNDDRTIPETIVKIDVGVSVNGAIGDCAWSVDLTGNYEYLIKASQEALKAAIAVAKVGTPIGEIGKAIEDIMKKHGAIPVKNLSGHGLARYRVHTAPSIPNFDNHNPNVLQKGMVIAIEPFATNGKGIVHEAPHANVFMMRDTRNVRSPMTRDVLKLIEGYNGLPFTTRWLTKHFPEGKVNFALKDLLKQGIITAYPPLVEDNNGMVAQFENTLYIGDETEVLTAPLKGHTFSKEHKEFI